MKNYTQILFIFILSILLQNYTNGQPNETTKNLDGWFKAGSKPDAYEIGKDADSYNCGTVYYLKSVVQVNEGFGTIMNGILPQSYIGKRLKLSGNIKTENVDVVGMWMRVDENVVGKMLGFDNMYNRPIKGTNDWQKYEIVLDIPETTSEIAYGVLMQGSGQVWLNGLSFDIVGTDIESTNMLKDAPVNDHPDYSSMPDKLKNIPDGIEVTHSPHTAYATFNKTDSMYYWYFETSVKSNSGDIQITEFGAYTWYTYQWIFGTITGKPFGQEDFHEWYHCKKGKMKKGKVYMDNHNWNRMSNLVGSKGLWYYIGKNKKGQLVKGTAMIDYLPELKK